MINLVRSRTCFYNALLLILTFIILSTVGLYYHEAVRGGISKGVANILDAGPHFEKGHNGDHGDHGYHGDHVEEWRHTARYEECSWVPDDFNILTVMKTGASEAFNKIPTQLLTAMKCIPSFYVFSDLKQKIGGVEVYDSLETMLPAAMDGNKDFDIYQRQKLCASDQESCNKGYKFEKEGWNLDKYKNIHISERSYNMSPDYDWYFTIDADTYVFWRNLVAWLKNIDPKTKHYIGHRWWFADLPFAYGGAGYLLSQAAMADFVGQHPGIANKYDVETAKVEGGDYMLSKALNETISLPVIEAYPALNPGKPSLMLFSESTWCRPIATLHHLNSEEVNALYDFEQRFWEAQQASGTFRPLLIKDIYAEFLGPKLLDKRENWDNLSDGKFYLDPNGTHTDWELEREKKDDLSAVEKVAYESFENCSKMCDEVEECLQFLYHEGKCAYHWKFALGKPNKQEDEAKRWTSGWKTDKIRRWVQDHQECKKMEWPQI